MKIRYCKAVDIYFKDKECISLRPIQSIKAYKVRHTKYHIIVYAIHDDSIKDDDIFVKSADNIVFIRSKVYSFIRCKYYSKIALAKLLN